MKLHLNPRTTIHSESPSIPLIKYNDLIVHYAGKYVYITDYKTLRILKKLEFKDVQAMKIHQNQLYVCTSDVNIISLSTYEITYVLRLSKSLINRIEFYNHSVAISKVNNKVLFYDNLELIAELYSESLCDSLFINDYVYGYLDKDNLVAFNRNGSRILKKSVELISKAWAFESLIYSISSDGILKEWINNIEYAKLGKVDSVFIKEDSILITNGSEVNEYSFTGSIIESFNLEEKIQEFCFNISEDESEEIIKRLKLADSLEKNGELLRSGLKNNGKLLRSNIEKINNSLENNNNLNESESDNFNTSSNEEELNENNGIYLGENNTGGLNSSFENNEEQHSDSIFNEENSGDEYITVDEENSSGEINESFENSSGERSDSQINFDDTLPFVQYLDNTVIQLNSGDFLIHENFNISKIVSFNDDLTDSVQFDNFLIISSSNGYLRYSVIDNYEEGEFLFSSKLFKAHEDAITSLSYCNNHILTGSKDKTAVLWKINILDSITLDFIHIHTFDSFVEPITSASFLNNTFAFASFDNILQIFKSNENFTDFENIFTQCVHSKQINHVLVTDKFVVSSSVDKTAKIFSITGNLLTTVESDKILHTSWSEKYIAVCSHKMIKVLNQNLENIAVLQTRNPVISSCFVGEYLVAASDVLRVYDLEKKKCVKSYNLELVNCWSFKFPYLCAQNKIIILEDKSEQINLELLGQIRQQKEDNLLLDKFCRENKYREAIDILLRKSDYKKMFKVICEGFYLKKNLDFLDVFGKCRGKLLEMLVKNPAFKYSEVFNLIVQKEVRKSSDPTKKDKFLEILNKQSDAIDGIYRDLLALEVFENK